MPAILAPDDQPQMGRCGAADQKKNADELMVSPHGNNGYGDDVVGADASDVGIGKLP